MPLHSLTERYARPRGSNSRAIEADQALVLAGLAGFAPIARLVLVHPLPQRLLMIVREHAPIQVALLQMHLVQWEGFLHVQDHGGRRVARDGAALIVEVLALALGERRATACLLLVLVEACMSYSNRSQSNLRSA